MEKIDESKFILEANLLQLKKSIESKYNIKLKKIEKSEESTDQNVYFLYSENEKYVAKIYKNLEHTKSMILIHNYLSNCGLYVPKIIQNNNENEYYKLNDKEYIVIYSFLKGEQISKNGFDENIIKKVARSIRKMHELCEGENKFKLPEIPFRIEKSLGRNTLLHFDLTKDNIFINNEKIGFIDFDDAKYGPAVCDVAIVTSLLFFSKTRGVDKRGFNTFLEEYYLENKKLEEKEVPLIKEISLTWIDYILNNNTFDTSTTDSFKIKKKLIDDYT